MEEDMGLYSVEKTEFVGCMLEALNIVDLVESCTLSNCFDCTSVSKRIHSSECHREHRVIVIDYKGRTYQTLRESGSDYFIGIASQLQQYTSEPLLEELSGIQEALEARGYNMPDPPNKKEFFNFLKAETLRINAGIYGYLQHLPPLIMATPLKTIIKILKDHNPQLQSDTARGISLFFCHSLQELHDNCMN